MQAPTLHVLIVDDSPEDRWSLRQLLSRAAPDAYTITEADQGDHALAAVPTVRPDCLLLDYRLPDRDGLEVLAALRAWSDVPVVLLTGVGSEAVAVEALQRGAQDYLVKGGLTPERLSLTIQHAVATVRLTRERDQMQALLATVLAALPVGVAVLDADLRIRHANPALTDFLGQPPAAAPGQGLFQRWPALTEALALPCAQLQRGERFSEREIALPAPSGANDRWLSFGGIPLRSPDEAERLALLTVQDITARREAEAARLAGEVRFRAIIENGTEGIILLDADLQPSYVSPTITAILGYAPEAVAALRVSDLCHPDDQPLLQACLTALTTQPDAVAQVTTRLRHQDGTWRWIEQRGQNQTRTPALASIIVSLRDVTTRVLAEQAARAAAERLTILAAASHAFAEVVTDEPALLDRVARLTADPLGASGGIWLRSADSAWLQARVIYDGDPAMRELLQTIYMDAPIPLDAAHPAAVVARSGQALLLPVIDRQAIRSALTPAQQAAVDRVRPHSSLVVPIQGHGANLGCLALTRHDPGQPAFTADDLSLAQDLANRAALALTNARLYQQAQAAQQAAAEALARLDALLRSVPSGIGYLDRELRYQLVNPALAAINHHPPEAHLGRTPQELLPDLALQFTPLMRQVLESGATISDQELRGPFSDTLGGARDWLINYFPVRETDGTVTGVGVTVTDVTVSKRTAAALQDRERKLAALFALLPVGISIIDASGEIVYVNPAVERIMRMDRTRLLAGGHRAYTYRQADGSPLPLADQAAMRARLAHQAVTDLELGFTTESGEEVWTSLSTVPVDFPDWRAVMVTTDITARKVMEAHLRVSEERHAFLLRLSDRLHLLNDPEAIQFEAACALGEHLGVSRVGYAEDQADDEAIVVTRHYTNGVPGIAGRYRYDDYGPELLRAFRAGHAVVRPDIANDPTLTDAEKAAHAALQLGATVNVPLRKAGRLIAVLFMHHHTARAWSPQELTLLEDVAARTWDAVERARAEATVRQQAAMLDHAHILIRDAEHRIVFWNQGATRLYGWTADEALGRTSHDLLQTRFPTSREAVQAQLFATGRWEGELVHHRRDGSAVIVASLKLLFRDAAGVPTRILEVNNDVTALKHAEEELRTREAQLRLSLDAAKLGVWRLDEASGMVMLDERARAYFGVAEEPIPLASLATRVHPDDRARVQHEAQELRRHLDKAQAQTECRVVHLDQRIRWLAIHARYAFSDVGAERTLVGAYGTIQDITQRKQSELALAAHAENLSHTNAALARALKLKDEFLAMMSHELRTPLNVVLGMSEALDEGVYGPITDRQHQILTHIHRSGRHLLAILSDILDLAHLEVGNATLDLQPIDVDRLGRTALQFVQAAAQEKGVQIVRTVAMGIEGLRADERRLTQIVTNLLDNAVKFTPAGGRVGLEVSGDARQERITLTVWDTGIGIAPEDMERLFQPFTQVDGRLSRAYEGIGLGLTLVRRLVDLHGGSISLESVVGAGSRFAVSVPWSPQENVAPPTPPEPGFSSRAWAVPPRMVIADDHELTLQFYGDLLRAQGCAVVLARTGAEAVAQVRAARPAVAILDIQMPELDGLSAIRQIRADPEVGATPIIALTALAMPGDRERCLAAGATAYLAKPVGVRTLIAAITEALAGATAGPAGA